MASMSALVLRIVFSCSFPFFPSFLLFCVCLPLSHFFHSRYFCSKQRTRSCSRPLMGSVYTCSQASKPDSLWSQICILPLPFSYPLPHPSFASLISRVFPALPCSWRAAVPRCWHIWLGLAWWCRAPVGRWASHSSPVWCVLSTSITRFSGKGTVCYSLSLPTIAQHSSPVVQGTICFFNIHSHFDVPSPFSELTSPFCPSFLLSLLFF